MPQNNAYALIIRKMISGEINTGLSSKLQHFWPRFAYHFTDITNAVSILTDGYLLSRNLAKKADKMRNDNASSEVIGGTNNNIEDLVRLYFRPKTPTQYHNEGFQIAANRSQLHADCPIPIFFLFDLATLLSSSEALFTAQSLAIHGEADFFHAPEQFQQLPFAKIFNNRALLGTPQENRDIIHHRQAEIVIPNQLDLTDLKYLVVRTQAERETLTQLLHDRNVFKFDSLIRVGDETIFFKDRNFIDQVQLTANEINVDARTNEAYPRSWGLDTIYALDGAARENYLNYRMYFTFQDGHTAMWPGPKQNALLKNHTTIQLPKNQQSYVVEIQLDDHIAYRGSYQSARQLSDDLPF
ncbi:DarT ssDNA thymidine ADP-ribosyltransferase family protein [Schleiferilactobacillus perolens]|uniref:DarT domain-containing protein n=1 Tax=Schleiferilactobacillus perolens DSM 12744 TaxID=1423792 RepID=A0A0R1N2B8_9LACO|nr:DarT ssDNA thymidine ADP-ribosyltransferase family protein [Schleiferilactobacillus perolens]KRL14366.1 hypothetical protein FD09_GL000011 [Schleiferilactobacillus perolens DSM 12744]